MTLRATLFHATVFLIIFLPALLLASERCIRTTEAPARNRATRGVRSGCRYW